MEKITLREQVKAYYMENQTLINEKAPKEIAKLFSTTTATVRKSRREVIEELGIEDKRSTQVRNPEERISRIEKDIVQMEERLKDKKLLLKQMKAEVKQANVSTSKTIKEKGVS